MLQNIVPSTPILKLLSNPIQLRQCEAIAVCDSHDLNNAGHSILLKHLDMHFYKKKMQLFYKCARQLLCCVTV